MKKRTLILSLLILLCCLTIFVLNDERNNAKTVEITTQQEIKYMLKEFNGMLALYENESSQPKEIFNISISSFPEEDIKKLKKGIIINEADELYRLLEDYTS